jgi:hypothetical protein
MTDEACKHASHTYSLKLELFIHAISTFLGVKNMKGHKIPKLPHKHKNDRMEIILGKNRTNISKINALTL